MARLAEHQDNLCFLCQASLVLLRSDTRYADAAGNHDDVASFEHVTPRSLGGSNRITNLVVAHRGCNSKRRSLPPTEDQLARLATLNEKRADALRDIEHVFDSASFGIVTPASLYLCDLLTDLEGMDGLKLRKRVTRILTRLNMDFASIKNVEPLQQWQRMAQFVKNDAMALAAELPAIYAQTLSNIIKALMGEWYRRKGIVDPVRDRLRCERNAARKQRKQGSEHSPEA